MSRIGRNPITVPGNVTIDFANDVVTVKGPNGTMTRNVPSGITMAQEGDTLVVDRASEETSHKALHGLTRDARVQHGGGRHRRLEQRARDHWRGLPRRRGRHRRDRPRPRFQPPR